MQTPTPRTRHISYKENEMPLLKREKELSELLCKNISDTYKYAMNKTYLDVMHKKEHGEPLLQY